jgi:hypothetical protein
MGFAGWVWPASDEEETGFRLGLVEMSLEMVTGDGGLPVQFGRPAMKKKRASRPRFLTHCL